MWRIPLLAAVLASWLFTAHAGEPAPCDGYETPVCNDGILAKRCCPKGARCNFRSSPHVDCGGGYCAVGRDPGRCPAPKPTTTGAKSKDACQASWEPACVGNKVTQACIMPVPTNYSGPERNPRFRTCGDKGERCTTTQFIEDCHPTRAETKACTGQWTKVCLGGKVAERCLPWTVRANPYMATKYVSCPDGSCAIGTDQNACPR